MIPASYIEKDARVYTPIYTPGKSCYGTVLGVGLLRGTGVVYVEWDSGGRDTRLPSELVQVGGTP